MIVFDRVSKVYPGGNTALKNVSLRIQKGEFVFVLGHSGAGKSTFLKLILREEKATSGRVFVNGKDLTRMKEREVPYLRRNMGVVFQDFRLFALPLGQNVAAGAHYGSERVMDCLSKADFGDRLKTLPDGLDKPLYKELDKNGVEVSGGEAQKIDIAGDKTAVYISHRLSSCKFCDDIAVFDHGAIVQYGTRDQLVADENGKYYELWHAQAQYYVKE